MTMELRAVVMFYFALLGATLPARALKQGARALKLLVHCTISVCWSQHGLKQIKHGFNARAGCEAALRSDGRLCLQSYYYYRCVEDSL